MITLIEKWKKGADNGGAFGALFIDLSKAFDCLSHEFLIAKLDTYWIDKNALKLVNSYFSNRKQKVLQGSILGPLLFNIFICDMFYFLEDFAIANYADDSTPYNGDKNVAFLLIIYNIRHQFFLNSLTTTT